MRLLTFCELREYLENNNSKKTIQKQYGNSNLISYDINDKVITLDINSESIWQIRVGYNPNSYLLYSQEVFLYEGVLYIGVEV